MTTPTHRLGDLQDGLLILALRAPAGSPERRILLLAAMLGFARPDPAALTQVDDIRAMLAAVVDRLERLSAAADTGDLGDLRRMRNHIEELLDGVEV